MIGKYIWQKEICEDGIDWVYVRCDTCGHKKCYLASRLLRNDYKREDFTFVNCDRCEAFALIEKETLCVTYASNEVFLK